MNWSDEGYRVVLMCGRVDVGAIYPPARRAKVWRWSVWVNESGHEVSGSAPNRGGAVAQVEGRFRQFLRAAELVAEGGGL